MGRWHLRYWACCPKLFRKVSIGPSAGGSGHSCGYDTEPSQVHTQPQSKISRKEKARNSGSARPLEILAAGRVSGSDRQSYRFPAAFAGSIMGRFGTGLSNTIKAINAPHMTT